MQAYEEWHVEIFSYSSITFPHMCIKGARGSVVG
jgi:hypothetical protein